MKRIISTLLCMLIVSAATAFRAVADETAAPRITVDTGNGISTEGGDVTATVRVLDAAALWSMRFTVKAPAGTAIVGAKIADGMPGSAQIGPLGQGASVAFVWVGNEVAEEAPGEAILPLGSDDAAFAEITLRVDAGIDAGTYLPVEVALSSDPDDFLDARGERFAVGAVNGSLRIYERTYADPVWTWTPDLLSASAKFVCNEEPSRFETVDASVTSETFSASCEEGGGVLYTAKVTFGETEYTDTKRVPNGEPASGHAWGEWSVETPATCFEKGLEKRVCAKDPSHFETREIPKLVPAKGDVNGDGRINAKDAVLTLRYLTGWVDANVFTDAMDYDGDGRLNSRDVISIMDAIVAAG